MENTAPLARKEIQATLHKRVLDFTQGYRQNVALIGEELMGKTTLLRDLLQQMSDPDIVPVYVEIVPYEFGLFVKRLLNSLLYHYLKSSQLISSRESLEVMLERARAAIPQSAQLFTDILAGLEREKEDRLFKELLGAFDYFLHETQKKCVLVIDEFHHLQKLNSKNIWEELSKKIMFQKNCHVILASSARHEARGILTNELSLLFGNFETLELHMLCAAESATLVASRLEGLKVPAPIIDFCIHFTGGHPFYLKVIADEIGFVCRAQSKDTCEREDVIEALERLMFYEWGLFNLKFATHLSLLTTGRNRNELIYLLDAIATGKNRLRDLAGYLRRPKKEITQKLNRLTELDMLAKNGSFYLIQDRLMSFWLRFVHAEKLYSLTPDHREQAQHFRAHCAEELDRFLESSRKDVAQRVLELFNRFENDEILWERKRVPLCAFKELRILRFDENEACVGIFGKAQDSLWLAAVKNGGIEERDVALLLKEAQKHGGLTVRKIMIGLGPIERNARLLAKESRVLTWDIAHINNLLDLFGQPRIIS
ncbi:MAG: AAA family ATPase [Deltaproteobacteria bacterium]